jgi:hypothetical protein
MVKKNYRGYFKLNNIMKTDSQITLKVSMLKIIGGVYSLQFVPKIRGLGQSNLIFGAY